MHNGSFCAVGVDFFQTVIRTRPVCRIYIVVDFGVDCIVCHIALYTILQISRARFVRMCAVRHRADRARCSRGFVNRIEQSAFRVVRQSNFPIGEILIHNIALFHTQHMQGFDRRFRFRFRRFARCIAAGRQGKRQQRRPYNSRFFHVPFSFEKTRLNSAKLFGVILTADNVMPSS